MTPEDAVQILASSTATTPLLIQAEPLASWYPDAMALFERHRQEISHYPDIPLNLDVQAYLRAEASGMLKSLTARLDGALVGYCVLFIQPNRRYQDSLQGEADVLYVSPEHRGHRIGVKLIRAVEDLLRTLGVQVLYFHYKVARRDQEGALFAHLGYDLVDERVAKRLDGGAGRHTAQEDNDGRPG